MNSKLIYAVICLSCIIFSCNQEEKQLPILGERTVVEKVINSVKTIDTAYHAIPPFSFMNQDSIIITNDSLVDKIYVADFFFTSCPSICPVMKKQMLRVYEKYKGNEEVNFLSHTIDPNHDSIPVLKKYATKLGITGNQWHFLRGDKDSVYTIAEKGYMNFAQPDSVAPGGFTHSGYFILVDKKKHIRGAYDGTDEKQVSQLMDDMDILLKEYQTGE